MKIRTTFVSNSSSTSFVLRYDREDFKKCQHCSHTAITPLEMVRDNPQNYDGDNEIDFTEISEYIQKIQEDINYYTNINKNYRLDDLYRFDYSDLIEAFTQKITKIKNLKLGPTEDLIGVRVSYHSDVHTTIKDMIQRGLIEAIEDEDE